MFEIKLAIAKILSVGELELADTRDIKPKRRGLVTGTDRSIQMLVKSKRQVKSRTLKTSAV